MNKMIVSAVLLFFVSILTFTGCEQVVSPSSVNSSQNINSDMEEQVIMLANSVDPYERYSRNEIYMMLEKFMHENPDIYATGFATAKSQHVAEDFNYIYKDGTTYITIDGYDYDSVDDNARAMIVEKLQHGDNFWSPEYVREDGSGNKVTVNTFFCPIMQDTGQVVYVLTADVMKEIN